MSFTTLEASRFYRVPVTDYGHGRRGTLVSSGSGLMLAVMDATLLRYCVEADTSTDPASQMDSFMRLVARYEPPLAVCGWFSLSSPAVLQRGAAMARADGSAHVILYAGGGTKLGSEQASSLGEFISRVNDLLA